MKKESDNAIFDRTLCECLLPWGVALSVTQRQLLWTYQCAIVEANRRFNLTRITDPADAAVKHHADSLAVVWWSSQARVKVGTVLDVGSGAGLPAIPLAVFRPRWRITAIDGTGKKARFAEWVADQLGLKNVEAVHARAEHWHSPKRFDLVLFKAVGSLERCLRWGRPLVARQGRVVVFKTAQLPENERATGIAAAAELGFAEPEVFRYQLKLREESLSRALWIFRRRG